MTRQTKTINRKLKRNEGGSGFRVKVARYRGGAVVKVGRFDSPMIALVPSWRATFRAIVGRTNAGGQS